MKPAERTPTRALAKELASRLLSFKGLETNLSESRKEGAE